MSEQIKVLKVFVASPSDLGDERRAIRDVAEELSKAFENTVGLRIQLLGWEDTMPGCGRPQALINQDVRCWRWFMAGSSPNLVPK